MRILPDFNIELSQAIDYILGSDIAKKAFSKEPFKNFTNVVRELLISIDKLADNCHMPEFTNHAMPHICSLVKRASEWGTNNGWLNRISSEEAGLLLLALIAHDIGMLSQDAKTLPDSDAINSRKGLANLANWTRQTHVPRLKKLFLSEMKENGCLTDENAKFLTLAADMGATHSCWPASKKFDCKVFKHVNIKKSNIMALCAVIAVVDLLDEDNNRCDTETLVKHKQGTTENKAHWARHTLTISVGAIRKDSVEILLQDLSDTPEGFESIYIALENHYRLIKLYNGTLTLIDAKIENISFEKHSTLKFSEFSTWVNIAEFKNNVVDRLLHTFMSEAKGISTAYVSDAKLSDIGIVRIAIPLKRIEENMLSIVETAFSINKDYMDMRLKAEQALLDGKIGTARNIAAFVFGRIDFANDDIKQWFWAPVLLLKYYKKEWELVSVNRNSTNMLSINSDYSILLKSILAFLTDPIFHDKAKIDAIISNILSITGIDLDYSFSTNTLIEFVVELVWSFADAKVTEVIDFFIDIFNKRSFDTSFLLTQKDRILTQINLYNGKLENKNILVSDKYELLIAQAWAYVFGTNWEKLGEAFVKLSQMIGQDNQYFISLQGLYNIYSLTISMFKGEYNAVENFNYYKYQQLVMENPLRIIEEEREAHIHYLFKEIGISPYSTKAAISRKELFRLIHISKISAFKYWDLGSLFTLRKYEAEIHISLGVCFDENNNYSGYLGNCFKAIIASISSTDTKFVDNNIESLKICVSLLDNNAPNDIRKVYDYIFFHAKPVEILTARKIISLLGDRIPEDLVDSFVDWSVRHYNFEQSNPMYKNLKSFNYFIDILGCINLTQKHWNKLFSIFESMLSCRAYVCQRKLYETIFSKTPKSQSLILLTKAFNTHKADATDLYTLAGEIYNAANRNSVIKEHCICILTQIYEINKDLDCYNFINWLKTKYVDKQEEFDFNSLFTELTQILSQISENGKNGICSFYSFISFQMLCGNSNWKLAKSEEREKFFTAITDFLDTNTDNISLNDFDEVLKILHTTVLRFDKSFKKRLIKFILKLIDTKYNMKNDMNFKYSPLATSHVKYKNLSKYNSYILIIGEFGMFCDNDDITSILNWFEREFHSILSGETLYYTTYVLLSICVFGDEQCHQRAGYYLNSIVTNYHMSTYIVKDEMLVSITKSVFHNIKNTIRYKKGIAHNKNNPLYEKINEFAMLVIEESAKALNESTRLLCAEVIVQLIKKGNYSKTDFQEIITKLVSDNCASVRKSIKHIWHLAGV